MLFLAWMFFFFSLNRWIDSRVSSYLTSEHFEHAGGVLRTIIILLIGALSTISSPVHAPRPFFRASIFIRTTCFIVKAPTTNINNSNANSNPNHVRWCKPGCAGAVCLLLSSMQAVLFPGLKKTPSLFLLHALSTQ